MRDTNGNTLKVGYRVRTLTRVYKCIFTIAAVDKEDNTLMLVSDTASEGKFAVWRRPNKVRKLDIEELI